MAKAEKKLTQEEKLFKDARETARINHEADVKANKAHKAQEAERAYPDPTDKGLNEHKRDSEKAAEDKKAK